MTNFVKLTCLKKLRDRWEKSPWKEKRGEIIKILRTSKTIPNDKTKPEIPGVHELFRRNNLRIREELICLPHSDEISEVDLRGIDFEGLDLNEIWLWNVDLSGANLRGTIFIGAHFKEVILLSADLLGALLINLTADSIIIGEYQSKENVTNLSQANLLFAKFNDTRGFRIDYGNYDLSNKDECLMAEASYRVLRNFFKDLGKYKEADRCYRQEMIAKRKQKGKIFQFLDWLIRDLTCGYGMKPWNVIGWIIALIIIFGFFYSFFGNQFIYSGDLATHFSFGKALYFSAVTFTTLGFGDWHPNPDSRIKFLVAFEALLGFIFLTLWIVTLARKIIRD
jgi:hypothetical protein